MAASGDGVVRRLIIFLPLLAGCGPSGEDYVNALKECESDITVTLHKNSWSEGIEFTCTISEIVPSDGSADD